MSNLHPIMQQILNSVAPRAEGSKTIKVFCPQDFPAPCGCITRFDNDGFVRWQQCHLHAAADDLRMALEQIAHLPELQNAGMGTDAYHAWLIAGQVLKNAQIHHHP